MKTRLYVLPGMLVLALPALQAQASSAGRSRQPVRAVQLISMPGGVPEASSVADTTPLPEPPADAPAQPISDGFRLHDLSRRWVEYQMRASFDARRDGAAVSLFSGNDVRPTAPAPNASALIATFSAIPVPDWMRPFAPAMSARFVPGCDAATYRPSGFLGIGAEARRQAYFGMMSSIACEYGLPVGLFDAMIIRESRYNPSIVSAKNAFGLTQLMPATAAGLGVDRYDVVQNLRGGASYLRRQLDRFGQYHLALAAYNAGPGRVAGAVPAIPETRAYVDDILRNWSRLSGLQQAQSRRAGGEQPGIRRAVAVRVAIVASY